MTQTCVEIHEGVRVEVRVQVVALSRARRDATRRARARAHAARAALRAHIERLRREMQHLADRLERGPAGEADRRSLAEWRGDLARARVGLRRTARRLAATGVFDEKEC